MLYTSIILVLIISFIFLVNHWNQNKGVVYLVFIILDKALTQYGLFNLNTTHDPTTFALVYHLIPLIVLQGPFFLYYLKSIIKGAFVWDRYLLFFSIPTLVFLINVLPYYGLPFQERVAYFMGKELSQPLKGHLFLTLKQQYLFLSIYNTSFVLYGAIYINRLKVGSGIYLKKKIDVLLKRIFVVSLLTIIPGLVLLFLLNLKSNQVGMINFYNPELVNNNYLFFQSMILPLSFFFVPNWLYNEKEPLSFLDILKVKRKKAISSNLYNEVVELTKKSDLDLIVTYIETKKPYLNPRFTLHDLSRELNIPHLKVSGLFNKELKTPYPEYKNRLRINHAIQLFKEGMHAQMSIEGISTVCGFKNKSRFYAAFKAEHKMTPIEWIEKNNLS
jgi:AraC-like DNA-binding protein